MNKTLDGPDGSYVELIRVQSIGWILHTIYVPVEHRGKGHGRELLRRAIDTAAGESLMLAPVPDADCPIDVSAWYERHGFVKTRAGLMMELQRDLVPE